MPASRPVPLSLPGGGTSPFYLNLLRPYLSNQYYPALLASELAPDDLTSHTLLVPGS